MKTPHLIATSLVLLAACAELPEFTAPELTPEQQSLRELGEELYQQVGWTYQFRDPVRLSAQFGQRHCNPDEVLAWMALEPGMQVADIGCGVGFFTFRLARAVGPEGSVQAVDIQEQAIAIVRSRMQREELNPYSNVETAINAIDDAQLAADSLDVAFIAHMGFYMQESLLDENLRMLTSVYRAVRPGGRLIVLEYIPPGQSNQWISANFQRVGFAEESVRPVPNEDTFFYVFRKQGERDSGEGAH